MSLIRNIDGELGNMGTGIGRALELTAAAANAADHIARRAAASGFTGIAQRMAHIRDMIQQLHGQIRNNGTSINEARKPVGQAPDQMSPKDTIDLLGPVEQQIGATQGAINAAASEVDKIHTQTAGALQGGRPEEMLRRLNEIKQVLHMIAQRGETAKRHVETALAEARQVGTGGN